MASISSFTSFGKRGPVHSSGSGRSPDAHRRTAYDFVDGGKIIQIGDEHGHLDESPTLSPAATTIALTFSRLKPPDLAHQPGFHRFVGKPEFAGGEDHAA